MFENCPYLKVQKKFLRGIEVLLGMPTKSPDNCKEGGFAAVDINWVLQTTMSIVASNIPTRSYP